MARTKIGIGSVLFFFVPLIGYLVYFSGAFSDVGVFPLYWEVSNMILWASVVLFVAGIINICWRIEGYAPIYKEPDGFVTRAVRGSNHTEEYFVRGKPGESLKAALVRDWPFKKRDSKAEWYAFDQLGNDVTESSLESIEGQPSIVFHE